MRKIFLNAHCSYLLYVMSFHIVGVKLSLHKPLSACLTAVKCRTFSYQPLTSEPKSWQCNNHYRGMAFYILQRFHRKFKFSCF